MCSSESAVSARSIALRVAGSTSSESSIASRILVGKLVTFASPCPPHSGFLVALRVLRLLLVKLSLLCRPPCDASLAHLPNGFVNDHPLGDPTPREASPTGSSRASRL